MRATSSKEKRIRYDINKRVISSTNTEKILQEKDLFASVASCYLMYTFFCTSDQILIKFASHLEEDGTRSI